MTEEISIIIPAAGFASRHPGKLLTEVHGRPALAKTVEVILESGLRPLVVLGHRATQIQNMLIAQFQGQIPTLLNSRYPEGMAYSIRTALQAMGELPCFAVHLGDKPFVKSETVGQLAERFIEEKPLILVPRFQGRIGHPAFFQGSLKEEVMRTEGDQGGRELVAKYEKDVLFVDVEDEGVTLDLDHYMELGGE